METFDADSREDRIGEGVRGTFDNADRILSKSIAVGDCIDIGEEGRSA